MTYEEALSVLRKTDPLRITVSGDIGAGKSTFAKRLAQELNIPRIYIGGLMREEAQRRGMTLDAFNKLLQKDDTVDRKMDALQTKKSKELSRGIFEGRTSWYFVEDPDVRTFLTVDPRVAAQRIWGDTNNHLRDKYGSVEEVVEANKTRKANEIARYSAYYDIDVYDPEQFDVVVDTTNASIDEVFHTGVIQIAEFLQKR